jgi:hypothetical protein
MAEIGEVGVPEAAGLAHNSPSRPIRQPWNRYPGPLSRGGRWKFVGELHFQYNPKGNTLAQMRERQAKNLDVLS